MRCGTGVTSPRSHAHPAVVQALHSVSMHGQRNTTQQGRQHAATCTRCLAWRCQPSANRCRRTCMAIASSSSCSACTLDGLASSWPASSSCFFTLEGASGTQVPDARRASAALLRGSAVQALPNSVWRTSMLDIQASYSHRSLDQQRAGSALCQQRTGRVLRLAGRGDLQPRPARAGGGGRGRRRRLMAGGCARTGLGMLLASKEGVGRGVCTSWYLLLLSPRPPSGFQFNGTMSGCCVLPCAGGRWLPAGCAAGGLLPVPELMRRCPWPAPPPKR